MAIVSIGCTQHGPQVHSIRMAIKHWQDMILPNPSQVGGEFDQKNWIGICFPGLWLPRTMSRSQHVLDFEVSNPSSIALPYNWRVVPMEEMLLDHANRGPP